MNRDDNEVNGQRQDQYESGDSPNAPRTLAASNGKGWPDARKAIQSRLKDIRAEEADLLALLDALPAKLPEAANRIMYQLVSRY